MMDKKDKLKGKGRYILTIGVVTFFAIMFLIGGVKTQLNLSIANQEIHQLIKLTGNSSEINYTNEFNTISNQIANIKPATLTCPNCICPKYAPPECDSVIMTNDMILALDQFIFRYDIIVDEYDELRDELKDNDRTYCKRYIDTVSDEYTSAFTYISQYISKAEFDLGSREVAAYGVLVEGNAYYKKYITDVEDYCINDKNKIGYDMYDRYTRHLVYYNELRINSTLPEIRMLNKIKVD